MHPLEPQNSKKVGEHPGSQAAPQEHAYSGALEIGVLFSTFLQIFFWSRVSLKSSAQLLKLIFCLFVCFLFERGFLCVAQTI